MNTTPPGKTRNGAADIKQELKQDAQQLKESAKQHAEQQARITRDQAVNAAQSTSDAIENAAQELRNNADTPDWIAGMLGTVATQIGNVAKQAEGKSPQDMLRVAQDFGRSNPATFLAASAAAGFAAGRVMRAGAEQHDAIDSVGKQGSEEYGHPEFETAQPRPAQTSYDPMENI